MNGDLRKLNEKGIRQFADWLRNGAEEPVPIGLISDQETSDPLLATVIPSRREFPDRYVFGVYLNELLKNLDPVSISRDQGLWSAMALVWFDLLCPSLGDGSRKVDKEYRYILSGSYQTYYRHLVRSPWQLVRDHGENSRFMLIRPNEIPNPLSQLDLTFDPEAMSTDEFIGILPKEFAKWRHA